MKRYKEDNNELKENIDFFIGVLSTLVIIPGNLLLQIAWFVGRVYLSIKILEYFHFL